MLVGSFARGLFLVGERLPVCPNPYLFLVGERWPVCPNPYLLFGS